LIDSLKTRKMDLHGHRESDSDGSGIIRSSGKGSHWHIPVEPRHCVLVREDTSYGPSSSYYRSPVALISQISVALDEILALSYRSNRTYRLRNEVAASSPGNHRQGLEVTAAGCYYVVKDAAAALTRTRLYTSSKSGTNYSFDMALALVYVYKKKFNGSNFPTKPR
jgi:hypothetical protein